MTESTGEEEILVLKSIFNEDFLSSDADDPHVFDLIVPLKTFHEKIRLIDEQSQTSTELTYLPPITLHLIFKPIYPPDYCLRCDYLSSEQLLAFVDQMDAMYDQSDQPIVYIWVEFLKDSFHDRLILPAKNSSRHDRRYSTNYHTIGSNRIYEQLIEYNRMQTQIEFDQTQHRCPICLEDQLGKNCLQLENCSHYACMSCLHAYAKTHLLNMQEKQQMSCYQCEAYLSLSNVRRILADETLFVKYQRYLIDMIECPRCHQSIVCIPSESISGNHPSFVECLYCEFTFCRRCEQSWHPQIECPKMKLVRELMTMDNPLPSLINPIQLKKLLLEIESIQTIEQCSKPCPSCQVRIEKNGGCQHMHCRACSIHFCWSCGWYGRMYCPHPCVQKTDIVAEANAESLAERIFHDEDGNTIKNEAIKRVQICPRPFCREVHVKIGTMNMILCGKCQKHFCFLCGEPVYGLFHYSQYGCRLKTQISRHT